MRREQLLRLRWVSLTWVVAIALSVWLTVSESPLWLAATVLFGVFLVWHIRLPGHLLRRQRLLATQS